MYYFIKSLNIFTQQYLRRFIETFLFILIYSWSHKYLYLIIIILLCYFLNIFIDKHLTSKIVLVLHNT